MSKETDKLREKLEARLIHVLIVNDDQEITDDCEEIFVREGYKVSQFPSYELLFEAIKGNPELLDGIDIIIADNYISGGTPGVDAVKTLRDNNYRGVIIAYSGSRDYWTKKKFAENGADAFIPLHEGADVLLQEIVTLLSQTIDE